MTELQFLNDLRKRLKGVNRTRGFGVCSQAGALGGTPLSSVLSHIFTQWPHFSGNPKYPVPCPQNPADPVHAETIFDRFALFPTALWWGEYGALRKDLLTFCIGYVEREIAWVKEGKP